jgi:hypothetical protein
MRIETQILKTRKLLDNKLFPLLVGRAVFFFLVMCLLTVFLYIVGTAQGFMDDTQLFLLRLGAALSTLLFLSALYGLVLNLLLFFREKRLAFIRGAGVYAFLGALGGIIAASALFIISTAGGNIQ